MILAKYFFVLLLALLVSVPIATISGSTPSLNDELKIVSVTPKGIVHTRDQILSVTVIFNKPMAPLRQIPVDESSGPLHIVPPMEGTYRWLGSHTLTFTPTDTLPYGTQYTCTIPHGTASLDGSTLSADYTWTFETPRPVLMASYPADLEEQVALLTNIELLFNQPMELEKAQPHIRLREPGSNDHISYSIRHMTSDEIADRRWRTISPFTILIKPDKPLQKETSYTVHLSKKILAAEGHLGMRADTSVTFRTHPRFRLEQPDTAIHILADGNFDIIFSTPVYIRELFTHLTIEPALDEIPDIYFRSGIRTDLHRISLPFEPNTEYTFTIDSTLEDYYGQQLGKDVTFVVNTGDFSSALTMKEGIITFDPGTIKKIPVRIRNVDSLSISLSKIPNEIIPDIFLRHAPGYRTPDLQPIKIKDTLIYIEHEPNKFIDYSIDITSLTDEFVFGYYALTVSGPHPRLIRKIYIHHSNMGVTSKRSSENHTIMVNRLDTGEPVSNVGVALRRANNEIIREGITDTNGIARLSGWGRYLSSLSSGETILISAEDNNDYTIIPLHTWRFHRRGLNFPGIGFNFHRSYRPLEGIIFSDRGIYRPGDVVHVKGIARRRINDEYQLPADRHVYLTVKNARNDIVHRQWVRLSRYGSFDLDLPLKEDAMLGRYSIELRASRYVDYAKRRADRMYTGQIYASFQVEEFRPAEAEVAVTFDKGEYIAGDTVLATIQSYFLFGAPMAHSEVNWTLRATPRGRRVQSPEGFRFGGISSFYDSITERRGFREIARDKSTLDESGILQIDVPIDTNIIIGIADLHLEARVTSPSNRAFSGRAFSRLHGGEFMLGIRHANRFIDAGDTARFDLTAIDTDGSAVEELSCTLEIIRQTWDQVRIEEDDGTISWKYIRKDSIISTREITIHDSIYTATFVTDIPAVYTIHVRGHDQRGNRIMTSSMIYARGRPYIRFPQKDDFTVELTAERETYSPGDTARIFIHTPFEEASALITIERDGIIDEWVKILHAEDPEIRIPVKNKYMSDVAVSVALIEHNKEPGTQPFRLGYLPLKIESKSKELKVVITPDREVYHPGERVTLSINVTDAGNNGVRSEVTLSVADAGVLNLINYKLSNPFEYFYSERGVAVFPSDSYILMWDPESEMFFMSTSEIRAPAMMEATAIQPEIELRETFNHSAYWDPVIRTNSRGHARVRFRLPDTITQFKVMAVAQTQDNKFGSGDTTFTVAKDLILQPTLPRFVRYDDEFETGVIATNMTGDTGSVVIQANVSGGLTIISHTEQSIILAPGENKKIPFRYQVEQTGDASFTFTGRMGKYTDGLRVTIPVHTPRLRESVALYNQTDTTIREAITIPTDIYPELGEMVFSASSSALAGIEGGIRDLLSYRHTNLESIVSRVYAIITAERMIHSLRLETGIDRRLREEAQHLIKHFRAYQRHHGGFVMWQSSSNVHPYLSAYALYVLIKARERGFAIDEEVLSKAADYGYNYTRDLSRHRRHGFNYFSIKNEEYHYSACALFIYALTILYEERDRRSGEMDRAFDDLIQNHYYQIPLFARAYLLLRNLHVAGDSSVNDEIIRDLLTHMKVTSTTIHFEEPDWEGLRWMFNSSAVTTASIASALLKTAAADEFIHHIVRWLINKQKTGTNRSPHDRAHTVASLAGYFDIYESDATAMRAELILNGKRIIRAALRPNRLVTENQTLKYDRFHAGETVPLEIRKAGDGRLYYGVRMNYYTKHDTLMRNEGIGVEKTISDVNDAGIYSDTVRVGEIYLITLTLHLPAERHYVVVDDPLPAGFEIINTRYETEDRELRALERENIPGYRYKFNHMEMRDDRMLLYADILPRGTHTFSYLVRTLATGTYSMPATHSEQLYAPDVFGRTGTKTIVIVDE